MNLPVRPPLEPMLAKSVAAPPPGQVYEPKWDGFRALVFRDGDDVQIHSRNAREIGRFFPEVVQACLRGLPEHCVVDGEIVRIGPQGRLDFGALQLRLHPARSRIDRLADELAAELVAFDLLAVGAESLLGEGFAARRARLEDVVHGPVRLTPATEQLEVARRWFDELEGAGLDGIIAKAPDLRYQPGKRVMSKVKHRRTADCVLAGYRPHRTSPEAVGSLVLGLYDEDGQLCPVGVVGALTMARRRALVEELTPLVVSAHDHPWQWAEEASGRSEPGSRWSPGASLAFVPLRPERVLEVRYDAMQGGRFRHLAQFERWRPDRDPRSCGFDQIPVPAPLDLRLWTARADVTGTG
ncbi:MAG: ATP-dependent DNA ligase [Actinomycetales bacterium]